MSKTLCIVACVVLLGSRLPSACGADQVSTAAGPTNPAKTASGPPVDFAREVQPILAKRCIACHGPNEAKGGLNLTTRKGWLAELDSGEHAVVAGQPEESELLRRITSEDDSERMPPKSAPLSATQIDVIRRWIEQGGEWQEHWAFQPIKQSPVPAVRDQAWVANPIDAFVLHKLEQQGLRPAPPADKRTLARRLYYDLTGLPPTPAQVQSFVSDTDPAAYERLVNELLASPRHGERWARHWLDLVRFAETNSFERDGIKPHAWRYRDYVIRAFNDDKPYDQFVREQLAGDELPTVTPDSTIATGYYRLGLWDDEPADRLQAQFDGFDDIVATTGQVFLGLTVNCARCHDHKIDPIAQREYYGLLAFIRGVTNNGYEGPNVETPIFRTEEDRARHAAQLVSLQERRNQGQVDLLRLEEEFSLAHQRSKNSAAALSVEDLDELEYRYYRDTWDKLPDFDQLKPETVGRTPRPLFDIGLTTRTHAFGFVFTGVLKVPMDGDYTFKVDSDDGSRLIVNGQQVLEYDGIHGTGSPKVATLRISGGRVPIRLEYFQRQGGLGLRVSWSGPGFVERLLSAPPQGAEPAPNVAALIKSDGARLLGKEWHQAYERQKAELEKLKREKPAVEYALCVSEVGTHPPETFILQRGNPHAPSDKVEPIFPSLFESKAPQFETPSSGARTSGRRRALADWVVAPDNRLTARVIVNRVWQNHFGRGIVRSSNNFGIIGDPPTHPELLDWLATRFREQGWRFKDLHRLILSSNTYRMSSQADEVALQKDPRNELFWRFDMRRLSAEEVRDSIHAVSGDLNLKMYGPGVYPAISKEVLAGQSKPGEGWGKSSPEDQARRSVYIHVKRSLITPLLADFDFCETDSSCAARFVTTQPAQALSMLNGEFAHARAGEFARRLEKEAGTDPGAQVRLARQLALCRDPKPEEVDGDVETLLSLRREHGLTAADALRYYCLAVLNLNEFIYLD